MATIGRFAQNNIINWCAYVY